MIRRSIRYITARTLKPYLEKKSLKPQVFTYRDIRLIIPPGVFHPGYFYSTKFLLTYVLKLDLAGKKLLEPGCGSGLISIAASKKGAAATATDIDPAAIKGLEDNSKKNNVGISIIHSDLFENIPVQKFDIIVINPPFCRGIANSEKEKAWYCGENFEFFSDLFSSISAYMTEETQVLMVLSDGCELEKINALCIAGGLHMQEVVRKSFLLETEFIFRIQA